MGIFEDLAAEQERVEKILAGLDEGQWLAESGCAGWTIADVVLHLAQAEAAVEATAAHGHLRAGLGPVLGNTVAGNTVEERAGAAVRMERPVLPSGPAEGFGRWRRARQAALAALRAADPGQAGGGVGGSREPAPL